MIPCENLHLEVQSVADETLWFQLDKDYLNGQSATQAYGNRAVIAPNDWEESREYKWFLVNRAWHHHKAIDWQNYDLFPYSKVGANDKYCQLNDDSSFTLYFRPRESHGNTCVPFFEDPDRPDPCDGLDPNTGEQTQYSIVFRRKGLDKEEEGIPEWEAQAKSRTGLFPIIGWTPDNKIDDGDGVNLPWGEGTVANEDFDEPCDTCDFLYPTPPDWNPTQYDGDSFAPGWSNTPDEYTTPRDLVLDIPGIEEEDWRIANDPNYEGYQGHWPVYFNSEGLRMDQDGYLRNWYDLHNNGNPLYIRSTEYWTETYIWLPVGTVVPEVFDDPAYQPVLKPEPADGSGNFFEFPSGNMNFRLTTYTYAPFEQPPENRNITITMICDNPDRPNIEPENFTYRFVPADPNTDQRSYFQYEWNGYIPDGTNAMQVQVDWEFGSSSGREVNQYRIEYVPVNSATNPEAILSDFDDYVRSLDPEIWFGNQLEDRTFRVIENYGDGDVGSTWEFLPNFRTTIMGGGYLDPGLGSGDIDWLARYKTDAPEEHPWIGSYYDEVDGCLKDGPGNSGEGSTFYIHWRGNTAQLGPLPWYMDETESEYVRGNPPDYSWLGKFKIPGSYDANGDPTTSLTKLRSDLKRVTGGISENSEVIDYEPSNSQRLAGKDYHTLIITQSKFAPQDGCNPFSSMNIYLYDWRSDILINGGSQNPQSVLFLEEIFTSDSAELLGFGSWRRAMSPTEILNGNLLKRDLPPDPNQVPKTLEEIQEWWDSVNPGPFFLRQESPSGMYTLVLNLSPLDGEVDLLEGVGAPPKGNEWVDIITDASQINIDRGFDIDQGVLGVPFAGTLVATIQDTNLNIAEAQKINVASPVRLRAGGTIIWSGILNALEYDWNPGKSPVLYLESYDGVALLNAALMRPRDYETYDARIKAAAAALGLPVRVYPAVDGDYRDLTPIDDDLTALQQVIRALDSEGAAAWVDREGTLNATTREWYKNAVEATSAPLVLGNTTDFTDNPSVMGGYANAYCLSDFTYENSTRKVINGLVLANETQEEESGLDELGNPILVKNGVRTNWDFRDENSERIYGSASIRLNTNLPEDTGALSEYADYIFGTFGLPRERIRNVEFPVDRFEDLTIPDEIGLDIGEGVDIYIQAPDGRVVMDKIHVISQVRHRITPTEWLMQLELI